MAKDPINGKENLEPWPRPAMASPGERTYLDIDIGRIPASVLYANDMRGVDIAVRGTFPSGTVQTGGLVGLNVVVTPLGTLGRRTSAIYSAVVIGLGGDILTGSYTAGEFEVINTNLGNQCTYGVIQLRVSDDSPGCHPASCYMRLRSVGARNLPNFVSFVNESLASAWNSGRIVRLSTTPKAATHVVQCFVNDVPLYLIASTTAPTD